MDCFIMILLLSHLVITGYTVLRYIDPPKFLKLSQPPSDLDLYCMAEFENNMLKFLVDILNYTIISMKSRIYKNNVNSGITDMDNSLLHGVQMMRHLYNGFTYINLGTCNGS